MFNMLQKKLPKFWKKKPNTQEETESVSDSVSVAEQFEWQSNDDSTDANSTATTEFQDEILETLSLYSLNKTLQNYRKKGHARRLTV